MNTLSFVEPVAQLFVCAHSRITPFSTSLSVAIYLTLVVSFFLPVFSSFIYFISNFINNEVDGDIVEIINVLGLEYPRAFQSKL